MSELKKVCVVDCGGVIARYRRRYEWLTDSDINAVMAAAANAAVEDINVPIMLDYDSKLSHAQADVMMGAIHNLIQSSVSPCVDALIDETGDDQLITTASRLEGSLVIVDIGLREELE